VINLMDALRRSVEASGAGRPSAKSKGRQPATQRRHRDRGKYAEAEAHYKRALVIYEEGYVDQRVAFYLSRDEGHIGQINADTEKLQAQFWSGRGCGGSSSLSCFMRSLWSPLGSV